jgi:hypothetical protein
VSEIERRREQRAEREGLGARAPAFFRTVQVRANEAGHGRAVGPGRQRGERNDVAAVAVRTPVALQAQVARPCPTVHSSSSRPAERAGGRAGERERMDRPTGRLRLYWERIDQSRQPTEHTLTQRPTDRQAGRRSAGRGGGRTWQEGTAVAASCAARRSGRRRAPVAAQTTRLHPTCRQGGRPAGRSAGRPAG